ncbi:MAG TPA: rhodanese-like domain-containing protein [Cytophagaceae bacterium]|nr:rhodanese-like domain-containing protein [Cytophagaceae bacterium]
MKQVFCLITIAISLCLSGCREAGTYKTIDEKEFSELAGKENSVILDVRTPGEYKEGHLENALLMDYKNENFENELTKLDPTKTYLVYCKAGGRSAKASSLLSQKGFNTYNLDGGISNWKGKVVR